MMLQKIFKFHSQHVLVVLVIVILFMLFKTNHRLLNFTNGQESAEKPLRTTNDSPGKQSIFLIPDDETLHGMTETELYHLFWRYVNTFQVLCRNTMRFGPLNGDGKDVCIDEEYVPKEPCLVYSLGSRLAFQFEEIVIAKYGCDVHTFDPSINMTDANRKKISPGVTYHEIGIDGRDFVNKQGWEMRTLNTIIKDLNHKNRVIDILKMDAEGGEWSGFQNESDFKALENAKQLLVEYHFGRVRDGGQLWGGVSIANQLKVFRTLYEKGFRICKAHPAGPTINLRSSYGPHVNTFSEISLLNLKWKRQQ